MSVRDWKVLLVAADSTLGDQVGQALGRVNGLGLEAVPDFEAAYSQLARPEVALVLYHLRTAGDHEDVVRLVRTIAGSGRLVPVAALSRSEHPDESLNLMRLGVVDVLPSPVDTNRLAFLAETLTLRCRLGLDTAAAPQTHPTQVLGDLQGYLYDPDSALGKMMTQVRTVAPQNTTVLLSGETGTGKTRLAKLIHDLSARSAEPFIAVNCGALSATLIESELFGHAKGSFTGADRDRTGKFEDAGCGTLLLDEIDSLPSTSQVKLLRAVEERMFEPVGSNKSRPMRARLIVACNKSLEAEVAAGRFRADLYYRLNVVGFTLPPLRERPDMIEPLARQLMMEFASKQGRAVPALSAAALQALRTYAWPGNIRELRNVIERAVVLCANGQIELADLPESLRAPASPDQVPAGYRTVASPAPRGRRLATATSASLYSTRAEAEAACISEALDRHGNNRMRAAAELGISRMTLYKKLHKYGLIGAA